MMPPHLTDTDPPDGGVLAGDTVTLRGYTFGTLDEPVRITGPAGRDVEISVERGGAWQGEGEQPGSQQYRSELVVRLAGPLAPGTYTVEFLDERLRFRVLAAAHA